jgi:phospholipid/cholesterol/gamma-HCH transport system substrate-binding protein
MNERSQRIRLGLFVFGALIALGTLIVLFGKRPTFFTNKDHFSVRFENAPNLQPGTPIRRSGIRIGEVERVDLEDAGTVLVVMNVDKRYPPRHNEIVSITQSLLSGDAMIDFITDPKNKDITKYDMTDTIIGRGPIDTRAAAERAGDIGTSAQETLKSMKEVFDEFKKLKPEVARAVSEYTQLSETIRQAVPEIQQTNIAVRDLARNTNANIPGLKETKDKADLALKRWADLGERLDVFMRTNDQKLSKSIDNLNIVLEQSSKVFNEENRKSLTTLLQNLGKMFGNENQKAFNDLLANVNKVLSEENAKNVNATIKNVKDASERFEQFTKDGSDAMKQVKETLGKADKVIAPLADHSDEIARNLTYTSGQIGLLMKDVRDLLRGYASSEGTVQKLLTDPALYNRANDAVYNMSRLMPKLELILEDLKDFSDQIARHPNRLIFNGGGGLKGSPFAPTTPTGNAPRYGTGPGANPR